MPHLIGFVVAGYLALLVLLAVATVTVGVLSLLVPVRTRDPLRSGLEVVHQGGAGIPAVTACPALFRLWWRAYVARRGRTGRLVLAYASPLVVCRLLTFRVRPGVATVVTIDASGRPRACLTVQRRRRGGWLIACVASDLPGAGAALVQLVATRAAEAGADVWLKASNAAVAQKVYQPVGFQPVSSSGLQMVLRADSSGRVWQPVTTG